jgi:hypothetical protein
MAALSYEQNCDSLTDGDLHGQDSWVNNNNPSFANATIQALVKFLGAKGVKLNGYCSYVRSVSAFTTGTLYYAIRADTTAAGDGPTIQMRNATQYNAIVKAIQVDASTYKLQYYSNGSYVDWQTGIATGAFHVVGIELDQPGNQYRLSWDGGAFGSYVTQGTSGAAAGDRIVMGQDATWVGYIDEFSQTYPAAASSIKSINGLAYASVKSVNGLAIASVKSFNGLS